MIRKFAILGASTLALTLSAPALADGADAASDTAAAAAQAEPATPTMSFGTWGVDPALLSDRIKPGNDFFGYVNQEWLDANPLPSEYSRFGAFTLLSEKSTSDIKALVDDMVAHDGQLPASQQRVVDSYEAFDDTAAINAAGLTPAQPWLNQVNAATTLADLVKVWSIPGMPSPVGAYVTVDQKAPDTYITYIGTGGLGLPDRDYYLDTSDKGREIQQKYRDYLAFLAKEAGYDDAKGAAAAVYAFEDTIARTISWDRAVSRNRDLTYHGFTRAELAAMAGDFPIGEMLDDMGLEKAASFVVPQVPPTAETAAKMELSDAVLAKIGKGTPGMFELIGKVPLPVLQAWTNLRFLSSNSAVLPTQFDDANFAFYGQTLRGQPEQRPRWKRAISETEGELGEVVGKAYVEHYFPQENKAAMQELVGNLRKALALSIEDIDWMGPETKKQAMEKLDSFDPKIGYRDNLETYPGLVMTHDPLANRMASAKWEMEDNVAKLGKPIDRTEWGMLPQTVNAYYNPSKNEIVFPAGILQQPFFGMQADPAVNYGAIGGVIGHEMGHGFDDQGSKSDATGALRNWWTTADREAFDKLGDALVKQYDSYCPLDDGKTCVNGRLTLGENIGDLGGLNLAYRAYKLYLNGREDKVIDGLTGDQRFFIAWAQVWRSQQREDNARQRLRTDPHSPEQYRVNGIVRNLDAWYKAFDVKPGDALYLPPEQRVTIW